MNCLASPRTSQMPMSGLSQFWQTLDTKLVMLMQAAATPAPAAGRSVRGVRRQNAESNLTPH